LRTIAVIGVPADHYVGGAGSSQVDAVQPPVTVLEGIRDRVGRRTEVVYESGRNVARAAQAAADADVAVVVAADREGEDRDRRCLSLRSWCMPPSLLDADGPGPDYGNQDALIRKVAAAQSDTVVVLETGGPVLMPWADRVPAIVEGWYPGQEGGTAIARVLFGDVNPSGHLPITFPAHERDPATDRASHRERYPGILGTARYSEGVLVGYRHYDSHGIKPTFPFGHGLSYTRFAYDRLRVRRRPRSHGLTIRVDVTNTGRRRGAEVVQTYLGMPDASARVTQPPKWLRAFDKVHLRPGQTKRVTMRLNRRDLAYWNAGQNSWAVADGTYQVMVGRSSRDIRLRTRTRVD
ncbi:MAG: glycoside hydrolase family 3 C-terminal domain-containing protein, partial [Actinomycetia bacterium]|nr:glycoside hydrolase family 3 C-terminal domain-containing protein [Actinomycetes bacterium]